MARTAVFAGCDPVASSGAVVVCGDARFTVLTSAMVRMEYVAGGGFEDRASQAFINRRLDVPRFTQSRSGGRLVIETDELVVRYREGGGRFDASNLEVELEVGGSRVVWRPGMEDTGNLMGTTRTLDGVSGSCALEPGLLSRDGWVVVDDSMRPLFDGGEWNWMTSRSGAHRGGEALDWYFMGYGRDYLRALRDYTRVAGRIPMVPRYVFGSWWSRYWPYTDEELMQIVNEFDEHGVGLDVLVVDMDWHLDGWTGYTWNERYFPDPEGFLARCRERDLRVTLNLHPADGVGRHEKDFLRMRAAMGKDRSVYRIAFDCTDRRFVRSYFDILHRPQEAAGIDFWWMDWQQERTSGIAGVDPLWWLNHLHWEDMEANAARGDGRALIFSRWGGLGNHRYQVGFSGDTFNDWASLAFQPYFTATAGNVGYGYWSHDIGGHQPGPVEDELYARWVQYGALSPVLRTHSGRDPRAERKIWTFRRDCFEVMREALALRYELAAYIYSATRRAHDEGVSLCRPLYWGWPEEDEAYERGGEYMFGDELLVAPVTRAVQEASGGAGVDVWLPPGTWVGWFTGAVYEAGEGGRVVRMLVPLDEIPMFARAGSMVCGAPAMLRTGGAVDPLIVHCFAGDGESRLYEDDGLSRGYLRGECAWTTLVQEEGEDGSRVVRIEAAEGSYSGMARERSYEVRLHGMFPPPAGPNGASGVYVNGVALARVDERDREGWWYDEATLSVVVRTARVSVERGVEVRVVSGAGSEGRAVMRRGLRGQLAMLDDIGEVLGVHSPREVAAARELRSVIASDGANGARGAAALQRDWWGLVRAVNGSGAERGARMRALCRLLGLSCSVEVGERAPSDGEVEVVAEAFFGPRFDEGRAVEVEIEVEAGGGWAVSSREDEVVAALSVGEHRRVRARLRHESDGGGVAGAGEVGVRVTAREEGETIVLEEGASFFPSINGWWVVGPFSCPFGEQMDREFLDPAVVDVGAEVFGKAWTRVERVLEAGARVDGEHRVDVNALYGASTEEAIEDAVVYATCVLESDVRREVELAIGSDDGVVAWLNGVEVHRNHVNRAYRPREDRVIVTLEAGANRLLLKVGNATAGWFFGAHVDDLEGRPVRGVRVVLESSA